MSNFLEKLAERIKNWYKYLPEKEKREVKAEIFYVIVFIFCLGISVIF